MKCSNCGNDLLVEVAPTGAGKLLRLLSVASYTCVRCGKATTKVASKARLFFSCVLIASLAGLGALHILEDTMLHTRNSVRRPVDTTSAAAPLAHSATSVSPEDSGAQEAPAISNAQEPAPDGGLETDGPVQPSGNQADQAGTTAQGPDDVDDATQEESAPSPPRQQALGADQAAQPVEEGTSSAATKASPAPAANPDSAESSPAAAQPPSPADDTAPPVQLPADEPALQEVVVDSPPKARRPRDTSATPGAKSAWNATLTAVRSGVWNGALVVNIDTKGTMGAPKGFTLASPPRYVVDVPGTWSYEGQKSVAVNKAGAKSLRLGVHGDKLRVVLDLERAPSMATVRRTDSGLAITVR